VSPKPIQRILVTTDGSEGASRAIETAARLAQASGARLLILTVSADHLPAAQLAQAKRQGILEGDLLERLSQDILRAARKHARDAGAADIEILDAAGDATEVILDVARREAADMVVIGRRGRGRLAGLLLGSVSQKLAALAPCSVVIVP